MNAVIYARVSTERQEKQETIQSQIDALREFAKANDHAVLQEYVDEGYSGEMLDRPALDRLRDDARKKLFSAVLIHSPDRLSRKYVYQELIREELKKHDIGIIFLNNPHSKGTPEDQLSEGVQGLVAQYEKAKILERTRRGKLFKAKKGFIVSSIAPYGYRYIRKDTVSSREGHYEVAEEEAIVVRMIFELFLQKRSSKRGLAKELTRQGVKPRKGIYWRTSTLDRILRNETYIGITHYNKHISAEPQKTTRQYRRKKNSSLHLRPREQWIPIKLPDELKIIDRQTFELAQEQLRKNSIVLPRESRHNYLLKGLVVCGSCGSPYVGSPCHGKLYYRCGNRYRKFPLAKDCNAGTIKADKIENLVWQTIAEAIKKPDLIVEQVVKFHEDLHVKEHELEQEIQKVEHDLLEVKRKKDASLDLFLEGTIKKHELEELMQKVRDKETFYIQKRQRLVKELSQAMSPVEIKRNILNFCNEVRPHIDSLPFKEKRQVLTLLVKKVILEQSGMVRIKAVIPIPQEEHKRIVAAMP